MVIGLVASLMGSFFGGYFSYRVSADSRQAQRQIGDLVELRKVLDDGSRALSLALNAVTALGDHCERAVRDKGAGRDRSRKAFLTASNRTYPHLNAIKLMRDRIRLRLGSTDSVYDAFERARMATANAARPCNREATQESLTETRNGLKVATRDRAKYLDIAADSVGSQIGD